VATLASEDEEEEEEEEEEDEEEEAEEEEGVSPTAPSARMYQFSQKVKPNILPSLCMLGTAIPTPAISPLAASGLRLRPGLRPGLRPALGVWSEKGEFVKPLLLSAALADCDKRAASGSPWLELELELEPELEPGLLVEVDKEDEEEEAEEGGGLRRPGTSSSLMRLCIKPGAVGRGTRNSASISSLPVASAPPAAPPPANDEAGEEEEEEESHLLACGAAKPSTLFWFLFLLALALAEEGT